MSDLEESDVEPDPEPEIEADDDDDETDKKLKIAAGISSKKLIENVNSDADEDDDDDDIDELESDDDLQIDDGVDLLSNIDPTINITTNKDQPDTINSEQLDDFSQISPVASDIESDDEDYLKKFEEVDRNDYINKIHPECYTGNSIEIEALTKVTRNANNVIIDSNHKTNPFISKYEKTKILGQRAKQLNSGAKPFVIVPPNIIEGYLIAQIELAEKKIPIIIRRPLPNGKSEYWRLQDLEII